MCIRDSAGRALRSAKPTSARSGLPKDAPCTTAQAIAAAYKTTKQAIADLRGMVVLSPNSGMGMTLVTSPVMVLKVKEK